MRIAIRANDQQKKELSEKKIDSAEVVWLDQQPQNISDVDAYFDLLFDECDLSKNIFVKDVIVFANAVVTPATELPPNYIRINAWNGFLSRTLAEVAASNETTKEKASVILSKMSWNFTWAPNEPGMIA